MAYSLDSDQAYRFDSLYPDPNCFQIVPTDAYWGSEIAETGMDIRPILLVAIVDIMGIDILAQ